MTTQAKSRFRKRGRASRKPGSAASRNAALADAAAAITVPKRWAWHYRTLLRLQQRLQREQGDALTQAAEALEPHSLSEADSASDEFDRDLALMRLSTGQNTLYEVTEALERIVGGTYGVCQQSGKGIPAARLKAVPWTRFSREVEEELEKQGIIHPPLVPPIRTVRKRGRVWLVSEEKPEELEEQPPAPPNDEALSKVSAPPTRTSRTWRTFPASRKTVRHRSSGIGALKTRLAQ